MGMGRITTTKACSKLNWFNLVVNDLTKVDRPKATTISSEYPLIWQSHQTKLTNMLISMMKMARQMLITTSWRKQTCSRAMQNKTTFTAIWAIRPCGLNLEGGILGGWVLTLLLYTIISRNSNNKRIHLRSKLSQIRPRTTFNGADVDATDITSLATSRQCIYPLRKVCTWLAAMEMQITTCITTMWLSK